MALGAHPELVLGGGDASEWADLDRFLEHNRAAADPQRVSLEMPARRVDAPLAKSLAERGVHGVVVHADAVRGAAELTSAVESLEGTNLGASALVRAEAHDPQRVASIAERLGDRPLLVEIVAGTARMTPAELEAWSGLVAQRETVAFGMARRPGRGFLPPCSLPRAFAKRPGAWRHVLRDPERGRSHDATPKNTTLPICGQCALAYRCSWNADGAGVPTDQLTAVPEPVQAEPALERSVVPPALRVQRDPQVVCVTPWTTLELTNVEGFAHQCCSTWTVGDRGSIVDSSLSAVWNGDGFRFARRTMATAKLNDLCRPICPWLASRRYEERRFEVHPGSDAYVRNQLAVADDIAQRREVAQGLPLYMAVCAGTYCNYDCIMCLHGRTPRRDLPDEIWEEIPAFMPTLRTLTLLGGEPLANPLVMRFLRDFDAARWPDAHVNLTTNGSLMTPRALAHMERCSFGDVAISLNAGTAEVYEAVQRGVPLDDVLCNIDALVEHRRRAVRWFRISVVFVVQPANAHTLVDFGALAHARDLTIRLLPLNPRGPDGLDYYDDASEVQRVLTELDRLADFGRRHRPEWGEEIRACHDAIASEARSRIDPGVRPTARRLPLAH